MPHLDPPTNLSNIIHLNTEDITAILKSLGIGKAYGPDCINYRILKATAKTISKPLIEFGIKVFFLNLNLQVYLDHY